MDIINSDTENIVLRQDGDVCRKQHACSGGKRRDPDPNLCLTPGPDPKSVPY